MCALRRVLCGALLFGVAGCEFELDTLFIDASLSERDAGIPDGRIPNGDSGYVCPNGWTPLHIGELTEGDVSRFEGAPLEPYLTMPPTTTTEADSTHVAEGAISIRLQTANNQAALVYPTARNASWDLTETPFFTFAITAEPSGAPSSFAWRGANPHVLLVDDSKNFFEYVPSVNHLPSQAGALQTFTVPLVGSSEWSRNQFGAPSLFRINYLALLFTTTGTGFTVWVDALTFLPRPFIDCVP